MADCLIGGLNNIESYESVITYFKDSATSYPITWDIIWPNQEPPNLENRDDPFIMLTIVENNREQEYIGSREYIIDKHLRIEFWYRKFSGQRNVMLFNDFVDSLGINIVDGVAYGTPKIMTQNEYKGWETTPAAIPFKF